MTDKQIIIYKKECYNEPHCSLNQVLEQLKAKEQECEAYKMEADEGKEINAELKAENKELKETFDGLLKVQYKLADNCKKLRQTLTEIKDIAQYDVYTSHTDLCIKLNLVKKKISEVVDE